MLEEPQGYGPKRGDVRRGDVVRIEMAVTFNRYVMLCITVVRRKERNQTER